MFSKSKSLATGVSVGFCLRQLGWLLMLGSALAIHGQRANAQTEHLIIVDNAQIVLGPPTMTMHGGYFELSNKTQNAITVTGVSSKDYRRVEIHRSKIENGVATMEPIDRLTLEAGQSLSFEAGGLHLMLIQPKRALAPSDQLSLTLHLADKRNVSVPFKVMRRHDTSEKTTGHSHGKHAH
jgi:copper(I)-binding protein